jgi:hypothetical protein
MILGTTTTYLSSQVALSPSLDRFGTNGLINYHSELHVSFISYNMQKHNPSQILQPFSTYQELLELTQLQLPPLGEECIAYPLAYSPMPQIARPSKNIPTLTIVKKVFNGVLKYCPRLMKSQNTPEMPYVNQEAKRDEMRARRSLKLGILQRRELSVLSFQMLKTELGDLPLCNNPCNNPQSECDQGPTTGREKRALAHVLGATEDADVDVFGCDMAVDHPSNDNLEGVSTCAPQINLEGQTVGMAMP